MKVHHRSSSKFPATPFAFHPHSFNTNTLALSNSISRTFDAQGKRERERERESERGPRWPRPRNLLFLPSLDVVCSTMIRRSLPHPRESNAFRASGFRDSIPDRLFRRG